MCRWIASLLLLALLTMPATAAGQAEDCDCAPEGRGQDGGGGDDGGAAGNRSGGSDADGSGRTDQDSTAAGSTEDPATQAMSYNLLVTAFEGAGVGGGAGRETCEAYRLAGTEPQPSLNPLLGILWLTPEDCLRDVAHTIGEGEAEATTLLYG